MFMVLNIRPGDLQRYEEAFESTPNAIGNANIQLSVLARLKAFKDGKKWNKSTIFWERYKKTVQVV